MRRPATAQRDMTDTNLRRAARALGYKGKSLPLRIADVLVHENRPNASTLLCYDGEKRRDAADRLRNWAWPMA